MPDSASGASPEEEPDGQNVGCGQSGDADGYNVVESCG